MTASQSRYERLVKAFTDNVGIHAIVNATPCIRPTDTYQAIGFYIGNPYNALRRIQLPIVYGRDEYDVWRQMFMNLLKSFNKTEDELEVLADLRVK